MTTLWMVRHGPTHAKSMIGWTDLDADLSDQAAISRLLSFLPDAPVVSSDLARAVQTANAIAGGRPRLPDDPSLREMHFGAWENRTWAEVDAEDPAHIRAFWETPGNVAPPGGESWNDLVRRVSAGVEKYISADLEHLIIVCHFGAILCQLQRALGCSASEVFAHRIDNLSVTRLSTKPWAVQLQNHRP